MSILLIKGYPTARLARVDLPDHGQCYLQALNILGQVNTVPVCIRLLKLHRLKTMGSFFLGCALQKQRYLSVQVQWDSHESTKLPIQSISVTQHRDDFHIQVRPIDGLKAESALKSFISVWKKGFSFFSFLLRPCFAACEILVPKKRPEMELCPV